MTRAQLIVGPPLSYGDDLPMYPRSTPSVMIDCSVEFDREAKKWRAFDELGNVAHDDWKHRAILRVFAMRLGAPMQEDSRG